MKTSTNVMSTVKSIVAVTIAPVLLVIAFQSNQLKTNEVSRMPAVEKKVTESNFKKGVKSYVLALHQ